ncbi:hypothetical protein C2E23DRAFT_97291 [Lenzites betulinus]|nr:hypothetical protein C2E23DRAFT_97291 [Lenzites betulinus]
MPWPQFGKPCHYIFRPVHEQTITRPPSQSMRIHTMRLARAQGLAAVREVERQHFFANPAQAPSSRSRRQRQIGSANSHSCRSTVRGSAGASRSRRSRSRCCGVPLKTQVRFRSTRCQGVDLSRRGTPTRDRDSGTALQYWLHAYIHVRNGNVRHGEGDGARTMAARSSPPGLIATTIYSCTSVWRTYMRQCTNAEDLTIAG